MSVEIVKLPFTTEQGSKCLATTALETRDGRIYFWGEGRVGTNTHFKLSQQEIRPMHGARYHGYDEDGPYPKKKVWSIDDCQRNRMQIGFLAGKPVYAWFDRPLERHEYRPLFRGGVPQTYMPHQADMSDAALTYHYQIFGAEMGTGKTLAAQMVIEKSGVDLVWWVGPKTSIPNIKREFKLWGFPSHIQVEFFTYEGLVRVMDEWDGSQPLPRFFVADESSRCKNDTSQRSKAVQKLADLIRDKYGYEGYVIEMSGTPSPKTPCDWWSQCEIAWPGFLKEGSRRALEERLAFMVEQQFDAGKFKKRIGWRDNEHKCGKCGETREEGPHELDEVTDPKDYHPFEASKNEVAYLYERLKGLVIVKHKKDCLNLPEKRYRKIVCKPTASILRVAESLVRNPAINAVTGMTLLRELSDGFQYREVQDGMTRCTHCTDGTVAEWLDPDDPEARYEAIDLLDPELQARLVKETVPCPVCNGKREVPKMVRITREVPCPKEAALKMLLDENEEVGRLVVFAGFTGSVDRIVKLCLKEKWDVVRCDQGNFQVLAAKSDSPEGVLVTSEEPLDYWANLEAHGKVVFVANPESGGMSLTLVEARMAVYWSNSYKPEYRVQSEDRIHRKGMDENLGCTIVDLIHLPSDSRVLDVIRANRKLELMTMGEILQGVDWTDAGEEGVMSVEEVTP